MQKCTSCGAELDGLAQGCRKCWDSAWDKNGVPWRVLLPMDGLTALRIGAPELTAWCCWGKIVQDERNQSGSAVVGGVVGAMVGGGLGAVVGRAVGEAINSVANGQPLMESGGQGASYVANMGIVSLTDNEVIVVDVGRSYTMAGRMNIRQVKSILADKQTGGLDLRLTRAPRAQVRAILRHDGTVLQLTGLLDKPWQLEVANLPDQPDGRAFVRAIMKVPELPAVDDFIKQAAAAPPDPALVEAMVTDGAYADQVLKRIGSIKRGVLGPFLSNMAASESRGFAVLIRAWLIDRAINAKSHRFKAIILAVAAVVCGCFAWSQKSPSVMGDDVPFLFWSYLAGAILVAAAVFGVLGFRAQWYQAQLDRFAER